MASGVCMASGGGMAGGMCGKGACMTWGHVWQRGMHDMGACVVGVCVVGACVAGGCVWQGVMHGRRCAWQGCMAIGAWQGVCVAGGGHAWQEREPLQRTVCILLECILAVRASISNFIHVS